MKGVELPINVLIIIAVAVIVLIAIIALFYTSFMGGSGTVTADLAKSAACQALVEGNKCSVTTDQIQTVNFDADKDGTPGETATNGDNLYQLCVKYYQVVAGSSTIEANCKKLCGCP